jgi:predicted enzyme related to lactoylglutathione lyase
MRRADQPLAEEPAMANNFAHIELNTDDAAAAKAFYKKVFDWKLKDMPMGPGMTYTMIDTGSRQTGGGLQKKPMPEAPTAWLPYVEVASVKRTIAKAKNLGAKVVVEYQPIPDMGAFGIFIDPTGAALGVWEKGKPARKPARKAAKRR